MAQPPHRGFTMIATHRPLPNRPLGFWRFQLDFASLVARAIRNEIRANRFARIIRNWNAYFYSASGRFARIWLSHEFPIRANHPIRANRANRFARITPLSLQGIPLLFLCFPFFPTDFRGSSGMTLIVIYYQDLHFLLQNPRTPEGFHKSLRRGWRVFEGFSKGFRRGQLLKPFWNPSKPFENPSETPSQTLLEPFWGPGVLEFL